MPDETKHPTAHRTVARSEANPADADTADERDRRMAAAAPPTRRPPESLPREHFAPDGTLTRAGMEHAIRSGGSVLHHGKLFERLGDLPEEAELVRGDAERERALVESYDDQIARLQRQKEKATQQFAARRQAGDEPAKPRRHSGATAEAGADEPPAEDKRPAKAATRDEWNEYAASVGVQGAADMATKEDVIEACEKVAPTGE